MSCASIPNFFSHLQPFASLAILIAPIVFESESFR